MGPHEHRDDRAEGDFEPPPDRSRALPHSDASARHQGRDNSVAEMAGEFGAELVRALRAGLAQGAGAAYSPQGSSQLSWYAFATEYARAHWPSRAAKTRDEVSDALTAVTLAMFWDVPGRPKRQLLRRALRHWAFVLPGPEERELPAEDRLVLQWGGEGVPAPGRSARSGPGA